jgi:hypothetical protein
MVNDKFHVRVLPLKFMTPRQEIFIRKLSIRLVQRDHQMAALSLIHDPLNKSIGSWAANRKFSHWGVRDRF